MNENGNSAPPLQVDLTGLDAKDQRMMQIMAQACAIGFEAGFTAAMTKGFPVEVMNEDERFETKLVTVPQLLQNMTDALDDCGDMLDVNNQLTQRSLEEQGIELEDDDDDYRKPKRKSKPRRKR